MKYKISPITKQYYKDNSDFQKFLFFKIIYPIVNLIGLGRKFNLFRHKHGLYAEMSNGLCQWCGEDHRKVPLSVYKEKKIEDYLRNQTTPQG